MATTWKVVNRHGMKVTAPPQQFQIRLAAEAHAQSFNDRGFDDGPFTVQEWGTRQGWYGDEGHAEADAEAGLDGCQCSGPDTCAGPPCVSAA